MDKTWTDQHGRLESAGPVLAADRQPENGKRHRIGSGLCVQRLPGALVIRHAQPGRTATAFLFAAAGLLFMAVAAWLPEQGPQHWLVPLVFELFAMVLLAVAGYLPFASIEVRADRRGITRTRRWCGRAVASRSLPPDQLRSLQVLPVNGFQGIGRGSYQLLAGGDFGQLCLLEGLEDRALLSTVQQQITLAAGISRERVAG